MVRRVRWVTLTTDVGSTYAAQIKAVLAQGIPPGHLVDLTHDLTPHRVPEAAFLLRHMAGGFPAGTVHLAVVDPGVGGRRAPIAISCHDGSRLVGPDNGLLSLLADRLGGGTAYRLEPERIGLKVVPSATFEGRDLFAPAAALLARGKDPSTMGNPVPYTRLALPLPVASPGGARGEVLHVDRFGNLITNVPSEWVPTGTGQARIQVGGGRPRRVRVVRTYENLPMAGFGLLGSSFGSLEISARERPAAVSLRGEVGSTVRVRWEAPR
ncbi:MAG: SAM-dependent chlorinase/fluorinase [Thermoplasmata archaeon]|nr:SAM-dependent chlorinase/fluorinase [Thermoplasmata archaeon]